MTDHQQYRSGAEGLQAWKVSQEEEADAVEVLNMGHAIIKFSSATKLLVNRML